LNIRPRKEVATDCLSDLAFEGCKGLNKTGRQTKVGGAGDVTVAARLENEVNATLQEISGRLASV
jgi:hypothetical protein